MTLPDAVIVVGASGFIGRNVVDALRGRVPRVIAVNSSGADVAGCDHTVALAALGTLSALPAKTAIVHVAAYRYFASSFARRQAEILSTNLALTDAVYRFAVDRGISEIRAASSSAVYPASWTLQDDTRTLDLNDWPHDGEAAYAWSKRWGEIAAELWRRRAGIHTISFRLTNPFGAHDTTDETEAHVATAFVIRALGESREFEVRGDPDAERDFVFAGDVASTIVESLKLVGVDAAVNLARGTTTRVADLAVAAMNAAGKPRPLRTTPPAPGANTGVKIRRATADRLRELLPDLPPFHTLDAGLRATVDWYRNEDR